MMAQEKKMFTLEDLIPGGETNHNFRPENCWGLQWWGDKCIIPGEDKVIAFNPVNRTEETLVTLQEINDALEKKKLAKIYHFHTISFPYANQHHVLIKNPGYYAIYDLEKKIIINDFPVLPLAQNLDFCLENHLLAYTIDNNLYVAGHPLTDEPAGIICGQSVHRNEFGIHKGTFWSPKGKYLAFYRMDESMVTDYPLVDVSARIGKLENIKYPMAGMASHKVTIGIYNVETNKTIYLQAGDPTDRYFTNITWSPDESKIYLIELNRDQNQANLVCYDAVSGKRERILIKETHPKYVEPLHPILFSKGDDDRFIYQSQKDGFNHLYLYDINGKLVKQLTSGKWLVQDILGFNEDGKMLYFMSTEQSPLESHLYKLNLESGERTLVTEESGVHHVTISASGKYIIDEYSSENIPRIINVVDVKENKPVRNILTAENPFQEYDMPVIETGSIKAADGVTDLYYRLVKPVDFDPAKHYPAIIYVYGGPHAQMIHNSFNWDVRGWDIYMAQKGYVVYTLDNRGSENRGLEFENVTFRQLGVEECKDQLKGVEFLKSLPYVDGSRIGVHGWSFGGHLTVALLLRYPDIFRAGVAGGPVIDWKFYEIMYGERYMDTPQANPDGYEECNLNNLAGNLKGRLLVIHDDYDHTCVLQHTLSFMKACVEARTYPDLFIYPGHDHNVRGRDRVHLYEKITRYFEEHL